jgi:predicted lipid-binding transport protein (Tim44 family)
MGDGFQFLDIVLFALVAGFLILRLRSVLGRRDGHHPRTTDPFTPRPKPEHADDTVVRLPDRDGRPTDAAPEVAPPAPRGSLEAGLAQIKIADPRFDAEEFISGARIAFELILNAFAAGDTEALKPLLSPEVASNFAHSIRDRRAKGQRLERKLVTIQSATPVEAYMAGRTAHVTVKFVSEQVSTLFDSTDAIVEGDPKTVVEVTDFWTFARDTRSPDPNWILVATASAD